MDENQKCYAEEHALNFPRENLLSVMETERTVLHTDLLHWYLENGLEVTKVFSLVQWRLGHAFGEWLEQIVKGRREAVIEGDVLKDITNKLLANSSYGYALLDMSRRAKIKYVPEERRQFYLRKSNFLEAKAVGPTEDNSQFWEISLKNTRVQANLPTQFAATVLCHAKLCLLSYYYEIFAHYLEADSFEMHAADTDSCIVALAGETLDECVKGSMKEEFHEIRDSFFVPNSGPLAKFHSKTPLLLKVEGQADFSVSLSPKSYFMFSLKGLCKTACKGVTRFHLNANLLTLKAFFDSLFQRTGKEMKAKLTGIRIGEDG